MNVNVNVNTYDSDDCRNSTALYNLRKGQLNRHTRYRPATTTRNTATQRSCHSVDSHTGAVFVLFQRSSRIKTATAESKHMNANVNVNTYDSDDSLMTGGILLHCIICGDARENLPRFLCFLRHSSGLRHHAAQKSS